MSDGPRSDILGVVLAGGRSRRYGSDKAFAELGGVSLVQRAARTLMPLVDRVVVVANDLDRHSAEEQTVRPDLVSGIGPLGGLHTAVAWAAEEGMRGAVVLATDMPFVPTPLLEDLASTLEPGAAVLPASRGPRGFEPLCAAYDVGCLPAIEAAIEKGDRAVISFLPAVDLRIVELARVSSYGDPDTMFFNVNRPEDHFRADALLAALRAAEPEPEPDEQE
ncbi:MAG: molybdenum cofactor guanylyltransferase [Gemmatimonadetes bacterium]|nr:molybdenum cofactor guanylyltransferase [Gemmatimonadota bacterium]